MLFNQPAAGWQLRFDNGPNVYWKLAESALGFCLSESVALAAGGAVRANRVHSSRLLETRVFSRCSLFNVLSSGLTSGSAFSQLFEVRLKQVDDGRFDEI